MNGENTNDYAAAATEGDERADAGANDRPDAPTRSGRTALSGIAPEFAPRTRYRRTTLGLIALGVLAAAGGVVVSDARQVLFALAGTGLFGALLARTLERDCVVDAAVVDRIAASATHNRAIVADEFGSLTDHAYVPSDGPVPARLRLSESAGAERESVAGRPGREVTLEPTAGRLFRDFERTLADELATAPEPLTAQLAGGLVDGFEFADAVEPRDSGRNSVTVAVSGSALTSVDRLDHPLTSFLAVGFATGLDRPVRVAVTAGTRDREWFVTCRWDRSRA